jgi:hypothetical protein
MRFEVVQPTHARRPDVEHMVATVFKGEYGATVRHFPDMMIAVFDAAGTPQCAAALRDATCGFFSEQYLDQPLEAAIARAAAAPVVRDRILELNSLAAQRPGALLALLRGFADLGLGAGYQWGVFTATARIRALAARMRVSLLDLGPALAERVARPQDWGDYYGHDPHICAVIGAHAAPQLLRHPDAPSATCLCEAPAC